MADLTDPSCYAHWVDERVRFSDTDAMGHVNNVALAAHVETGRVAYALELFGRLRQEGRGVVLRRLEVDYRSEAHYPEALRVGSRLLSIGRTSFTVGSGVFAGSASRCVATAESVLVVLGDDGPTPIAAAGREVLEAELDAPAG